MSTPSLQVTGFVLRVPERISPGSVFWSVAERVLAGSLLIAALPVMAMVSITVTLASRKTPVIAHRRVGRYGQEFWMFKIRTMWGGGQSSSGGWIEYLGDTHVPAFKGARDPRVTSRFALFLRRFSLDELPQLIHVISGRMRLVGPRPVTGAEWNEYYGARSADVLSVAPGITGLWQVLGRNRLTYGQRRRLDLFYARHRTPQLDLLLLLRTPARVLSGRDAG
jgi:exopolysaccharide production protein ExoY